MSELVKPEDIEGLVELFHRSTWREMRLRYKDVDLFLSKDEQENVERQVRRNETNTGHGRGPKKIRPASSSPGVQSRQKDGASDADVAVDTLPSHWIAITAPNLGTFYRSPKPGASPFVELGQSVTPDTELCLIEVMKLFTALKAGASGVVMKICAEDGELIKSGQTLFYIEPDTE